MKLTLAVLKAAAAAALINLGIFYMGKASGSISESVIIPNANEPLTAMPVLLSSILPILVAGVIYYLLTRFSKKPRTIFNIIACILLVLSFFTPFSIPGVPLSMVVLLLIMHVVVAGCVLWFFNTGMFRKAVVRP